MKSITLCNDLNNNICPCKGCAERYVNCHSLCEQYKAWNQKHQETREQIRQAKMKDIEAYRRKKCAVEKYQRSGRH